MADINSGLPIRSQLPGQSNYDDIIMKIGDGANPTTQLLGVDSAGRITIKLQDGAGNAITSQANGSQQALDVGINVAGVQVDPRSIRTLTNSDVVTVEQGTSPWVTRDQSDGSPTGGTAATFSSLAGGLYNTALPTLADGQQSAIQLDSSGRIIIAPLTNASVVKAQLQDNTGAAITLGQKTMAASVPVVLASDQTPIPVTISADAPGTEVNDYNTASAIAAAGTSNHIYTVTAGKTLLLTQIEAAASGKMKIEVQVETGVATGTYTTKFVKFNSSANPGISIQLKSPISVAAGVRVRIIRTNTEILLAQDLYSTISGQETP